MKRYSLRHLSDVALTRALATAVIQERATAADVLAHIAEFDDRKLYRETGFPSMYNYCLEALHMSEDMAYKRIQAARAARRFPAIFAAVAGGRLHLSAVCLLAPHLTEGTAPELMAAAMHKSKSEIVLLLAQRFPQPDVPARVQAIAPPPEPAPGQVRTPLGESSPTPGHPEETTSRENASPQPAPGQVQVPSASPATPDRGRVKPLAPQRFAVQFTMSQSAHDKLRYAQELLCHQIAAGDLAEIFERALDALIPQLEKRKFAATSEPRPRPSARSSENSRHIPARVKRAVWKRDGAQCTFVSENGRRCQERKGLEFDHVLEVARGGDAGVGDIQLRCRAHNQHGAERTFGSEFMRHKRVAAAEARAGVKRSEVPESSQAPRWPAG